MHLIHDKGIQLKILHKNTNVEISAGMLQLQDMLQCFPSCFYPNLEWNFTQTLNLLQLQQQLCIA